MCCCVLLRVVSVTEHVLVRCNVRCPGLSVVRLWDAVRCPRASMGWDEAVQCLWLSVCGGGKVDTDLAVEFKLRAQDVHSKVCVDLCLCSDSLALRFARKQRTRQRILHHANTPSPVLSSCNLQSGHNPTQCSVLRQHSYVRHVWY